MAQHLCLVRPRAAALGRPPSHRQRLAQTPPPRLSPRLLLRLSLVLRQLLLGARHYVEIRRHAAPRAHPAALRLQRRPRTLLRPFRPRPATRPPRNKQREVAARLRAIPL